MQFKDLLHEDTLDDLLGAFDTPSPAPPPKKEKSNYPKDFHKFKDMSESEFKQYVKKNIKIQKNKFKLKYKADKTIPLTKALRLPGRNNEKRRFTKSSKIGSMFGNFALSEWFHFLKDIGENGLQNPVHIIIENGKETISEGNHRLQALQQLGFTKVPVIITRK